MNQNNEIKLSMTLKKLLKEYNQILIPDLQRDYVMGANKELFDKLIKDIQEKCADISNIFDFGCIIGNFSDDNLYIYDGQQRLATLAILVCYQLGKKKEEDKEGYKELIKSFKFKNRDEANNLLDLLLEGKDEEIENFQAVDLTTWSILKMINSLKNIEINVDKLMNQVTFKCIPIDKKGIAEQLFFDLNEGVILKDYEIFKSELDMQIRNLIREGKVAREEAEVWFDKIDNDWLDWCYRICKSKYKYLGLEKIEEKEILIIFYIIKMIYIEDNEEIQKVDIEKFNSLKTIDMVWIKENFNANMFFKIIDVMDKLQTVKNVSSNEREEFYVYVGNKDWHQQYATRYFNLNCIEYNNWIIDKLMKLEINKYNHIITCTGTVNDEIIAWTYINLMDIIQGKHEYIRLIKKLLNQNRRVNSECFYYVSEYTNKYIDHIQFSRQIVNGNDNSYDYNIYHLKVIKFIKDSLNNVDKISINKILELLNEFGNCKRNKNQSENVEFEDVCKREYIKYEAIFNDKNKGEEIKLFENDKLFNGIIDNIWDSNNKELYMYYDVFNMFFKYNDCLDNREKDARQLLSILQFQENKVLLYNNIICRSDKSFREKIYIPNKDIIDIMVSSGDEVAKSIREYLKKGMCISKIGKYSGLAYALGAEKDYNKNETGMRERIYVYTNKGFKFTRPEHRAEAGGDYDQTQALNCDFISYQDINRYLYIDTLLAKKCQEVLDNIVSKYKARNLFKQVEKENNLKSCFFRITQNIIGNDFPITSFIIGMIIVVLKTNGSVILRNKELRYYYNGEKNLEIYLNDRDNGREYIIKYNEEGKIVFL